MRNKVSLEHMKTKNMSVAEGNSRLFGCGEAFGAMGMCERAGEWAIIRTCERNIYIYSYVDCVY